MNEFPNEDLSESRNVYERRGEIQILDVRELHEWVAGHVEGSFHLPLNRLMAGQEELNRELPVAVVCAVGSRSEVGALMLRARGYDAYNVEGGLHAWFAEGLPLVDESSAPGRVF